MGTGQSEFLNALLGARALLSCKRLSLSKSQDGAVTVGLTALKGDIDDLLTEIDPNSTETVRVVSRREEPPLASITIQIRSEQDSLLKVRKEIVFKSIPKSYYEMYQHYMLPKTLVPSTSEPDLQIRVKTTDDWFGAEGGWRVAEIFEALCVPVSFPDALDYTVYELRIKQGTPVVSLIQHLLPIPGLIISQWGGEFFITPLDSCDEPQPPIAGKCYEIGRSVNHWKYKSVVHGLTAKPKSVIFEGPRELDMFKLFQQDGFIHDYFHDGGGGEGGNTHVMKINLAGGIYGVDKTSYVSADLIKYLHHMYRFTEQYDSAT